MSNQPHFQRRSDGACINKVPLPPVRSQAGAGYSVAPGMGVSELSGTQKATCASTITSGKPYKLIIQYKFDENPSVLSPISIARSLEHMFPDDKDMSIFQNQTNPHLMIEVTDDVTYKKLLKLSAINQVPVKIEDRSTSNTTKGHFHCEDDLELTEAEKRQVKEQGVIDLYRIQHTNMYAVTFNKAYLPETLKISRLVFRLRIFIPKPRRCFKCQRYGHNENHCLHSRVCPKCSQPGHTFEECKNSPSCYHCYGQHQASSHHCPRFILEKLVLEYKVTQKIDFSQARSYIYKVFPDLVNKIPHLKPYNPTPVVSTVETSIPENLKQTIEGQQNQIDHLTSELKHLKSFSENKTDITEPQPFFHESSVDENSLELETRRWSKLDQSQFATLYFEDLTSMQDACENVIPLLPMHHTPENTTISVGSRSPDPFDDAFITSPKLEPTIYYV